MTIRKIVLSLGGLLTLSCSHMQAQVGEPRSELSLGFTGGVALNSMSFDPTIKQNLHVGPTMGAVLRYTCEKYFKTYCALQAELLYSSLGWNEQILNSSGDPLPDTYERHLHYVQLPLLARLAWGREHRGFMGFVVAGPQLGFLLSEGETRSSQWTLGDDGLPDRPNNLSEQYDMKADHRFDYGIAAGLGAEIGSKLGHFVLEGRYYYGLADIFSNSKKDVFQRSAHGTIYVKASWLIDL